jgi:hypothetical protein
LLGWGFHLKTQPEEKIMEDRPADVAPQFTVYVNWKNGDENSTYKEISGYSVSEGCLFLSRECCSVVELIGIPLSGVQSYELYADEVS